MHWPRRRTPAHRPVRPAVRRPRRHRRITGCEPVHRLPQQVPDQARRRLPPGHHPAQHGHAERLTDALRYEPCSLTCANWLRYGIQPKIPRPGLRPKAKHTAANISATPGAASWYPANGPARPSLTTELTGANGSSKPSVSSRNGSRSPARTEVTDQMLIFGHCCRPSILAQRCQHREDDPIAVAKPRPPSAPSTRSPTPPIGRPGTHPLSTDSSTNTSGLRRSPGQRRWPDSDTPRA